MRQIQSLIWKEWHETCLFLWIAWGLFIGLPVVGGFEAEAMNAHRFEFWASPWVIFCGPILAIVVGVACTCRDLQSKLEDFWQSRPMGTLRLFAVKYFVAIAIILLACDLPLAIEFFSTSDKSIAKAAVSMSLFWTAAFSTAFACGCIFRKPAHAAAMAFLAMLLLDFLPVVFPPLERFNVGNVLDAPHSFGPAQLAFAGGMVLVAIVALLLSFLAVRLRWRIESGQPLIYAAVSCAFLVLLVSASYQLGTNLPILAQRAAAGYVRDVDLHDGALTAYIWYVERTDRDGGQYGHEVTVPLAISNNQFAFGSESPAQVPSTAWSWRFAFSERDHSVRYEVDPQNDGFYCALGIFKQMPGHAESLVQTIELWQRGLMHDGALAPRARIYQYRDRLYVVGERSIVFDISDPIRPRKMVDSPMRWEPSASGVVPLPPAPGLPIQQRLDLLMDILENGHQRVFDRNLLLGFDGLALITTRVELLPGDRVKFQIVGKYLPPFVQSIFAGFGGRDSLRLENGLLYALSQTGVLRVFSISDNAAPRLIAHFAAPDLDCCQPLPDGRAIIGAGTKLYLLGPPPRH